MSEASEMMTAVKIYAESVMTLARIEALKVENRIAELNNQPPPNGPDAFYQESGCLGATRLHYINYG